LKGGCIPLAGDLALNLINIIFVIFGFSSQLCRRSPHQPSVLLIGACVMNLGLHASDDAHHACRRSRAAGHVLGLQPAVPDALQTRQSCCIRILGGEVEALGGLSYMCKPLLKHWVTKQTVFSLSTIMCIWVASFSDFVSCLTPG
jgi:hypothetical protein